MQLSNSLSMKEDKKILVEQVKGWRGQKATTDEEKRRRKNVKDTKKTLNAKIKNMLAERKVLNSAYLTSFHLEASCRKVYNNEYKKRKTHQKDIRMQIEIILRKHGIDRAAHHGGELTGPFLRNISE